MAIGTMLKPVGGMFSNAITRLAGYKMYLFIAVGVFMAVAGVFIFKAIKGKKTQWTHTLRIKRVLQNKRLSKEFIIKMRRFPLIKRAEVFELEKPLLGGYLFPELDQYSDINEYSIIIDVNNRIYTNMGEFFDPNSSSVYVSAKHSEIDISRSDLRANYQNINKTSKKVEWGTIAKYTFMAVLILAVMVVSIVAIGEWGDAQKSKVELENAQAKLMENLAEAMTTSQATVNTQILIIDKLNELYNTTNIQGVIQNAVQE